MAAVAPRGASCEARRASWEGPVITTDDHRPQVLLIDDSQEILDLLRELLEDDGYRVLVSREMADVPRLRGLLPEVIVDEMLVGGRPEAGWQYLTLTLRDPVQPHVSLVLCTTAAATVGDPALAEHLDYLGVRVLCQPFLIGDLLEMVATSLSGSPLAR